MHGSNGMSKKNRLWFKLEAGKSAPNSVQSAQTGIEWIAERSEYFLWYSCCINRLHRSEEKTVHAQKAEATQLFEFWAICLLTSPNFHDWEPPGLQGHQPRTSGGSGPSRNVVLTLTKQRPNLPVVTAGPVRTGPTPLYQAITTITV